jgi:hypothetical protein
MGTEVGRAAHALFSGGVLVDVPAAPPVCALDFEAIGPAIPLYEGTEPYRAIAFQWSLHRLGAAGAVEHFEYLAEGREDPDRRSRTALPIC